MLFKLAYRNIIRSKGYFLAYAVSLAIFAVLVYSTSIIEIALGQFFMDGGANLNDIDLASLFTWIKVVTYITVLLFSVYISNFFLKRRSKEIALYKMFGLSRRNIFQLFVIENTCIISLAFIFSIIFGLFFSRLVLMLAMQLFNIDLQSFPLTLPKEAIISMGIILSLVWLAIVVLPLKLIANSSISTLFLKRGEETKPIKFPFISFSVFILSIITIIYVIFYLPDDGSDVLVRLVSVYLLSIVIAFSLYKGGVTFVLQVLKKRGIQFSSPVFLLTVNHFIASIRSTYRLLTFVTVFTATIAVSIVTIFGALNLSKYDTETFFSHHQMAVLTVSQDAQENFATLTKELPELQAFETIPLILENRVGGKTEKFIMTSEQFQLYATFTNMDEQLKKKVLDKIGTTNEPLSLHNIVEIEEESEITYYLKNGAELETESTKLPLFFSPDLVFQNEPPALTDNQQAVFLNVITKEFTSKDMFNVVSLFSNPLLEDTSTHQIFLLGYTDILGAASVNFFYALFQLVLFIVVLGIIIALIMALFFRTLEIVENNIEEYMIARTLGFTNKQTFLSILVETAFTQLLPFYIGSSVGLVIFQGLFRLLGMSDADTVLDLLREPVTLILFGGFFLLIHILYAILLINIYTKIKNEKMVK